MRFVVFECQKCGHLLYAENTDDLFRQMGKVSNLGCPNCGEDADRNWVLIGLATEFPYPEKGGE